MGTMLTQTLDRLGNWNPQLLRELKKRLTPLSITFAMSLSILVQGGLILFFILVMLPAPVQDSTLFHLYLLSAPQLVLDRDEQGYFVGDVKPIQAAHGKLPPAAIEAEQRIRPGDRILTSNGSYQSYGHRILANNDKYQTFYHQTARPTLQQLTGEDPLGEPFTLKLLNKAGEFYTVSLPLVIVSDYYHFFCITLPEDSPPSRKFPPCQLRNNDLTYEVNWSAWYLTLFVTLTLIFGGSLVWGGSLMLFKDLKQEQRQGTFNLIRLSSRSARSIVIGKILGVPAQRYLFVVVAVPLHCFTGLAAGFSGISLVFFYFIFSLQSFLFYNAVCLLTLARWNKLKFQSTLYSCFGVKYTPKSKKSKFKK